MALRVAVLIENSRAWGRGLIRGIARYSRLHGPWHFLKTPAFFTAPSHMKFLDEIKEFNPDAIIMREVRDAQKIIDLGKPVVVSGHRTKRFKAAINIVEDTFATGRMAAEHLLSKGLRNFAFCGYDAMFWSRERCEGFCEKISESGYPVFVYRQSKSKKHHLWEYEKPLLAHWLLSLPKPVGLMCCIDERSDQVAEICKIEGIHVPEEIAIIGVDNDDMICELSTPPLSSIAFKADGIGYQAAQLLDEVIKGGRLADTTELVTSPAYVVQRQSTDIIAIEDPVVAEAMAYITQNAYKSIRVEDVLQKAIVPRRTLERKFHTLLGNSIYKEIQNERLKHIERMLIETDMTISEIAYSLNFADSNELSRFFSRLRKMSPSSFRRKYFGDYKR